MRNYTRMAPLLAQLLLGVGVGYAPHFAMGAAQVVTTANSITGVSVGTLGSDVVVRIKSKEPLKQIPVSFATTNPSRVVFDFPGTSNDTGKSTEQVNQALLTSFTLVQSGDRSRLVLNTLEKASYTTRLEGNETLIVLRTPQQARSEAEIISAQAEHKLQDVLFRRGNNGEGKVVVNLDHVNVSTDVRTQGKSIVVDLFGTSIPDHLIRKLDVTDFATPVNTVTAQRIDKNTVRLTISPKGTWEHNAYQVDNQLMIDVREVKSDPNRLVQSSRNTYEGEKITLNFQSIPVRQLLQTLAREFDYNVVMSESVTGSITLDLKDVPWDQAFDLILQRAGLGMKKTGNVLLIAPRPEIALMEKQELEALKEVRQIEPLKTERFVLKYHKAADVKLLLRPKDKKDASLLSERGSAVADPYSNTIFVQDTPSSLEDVRKLIAEIDIPRKQVVIEARIVEANDTFSQELGIRLGLFDNKLHWANSGKVGFSGTTINDLTLQATQNTKTQTTASLSGVTTQQVPIPGSYSYSNRGEMGTGFRDYITIDDGKLKFGSDQTPTVRSHSLGNVDLPAKNAAGNLMFSIFNKNLTNVINVEISAEEADGKAKRVASPKILTSNQQVAEISQGYELPYLSCSSDGCKTEFREAVLKLDVTPQITPEGHVLMDLKINNDQPDFARRDPISGMLPIEKNSVRTRVLVENGGTVSIGGIYRQTDTKGETRIPFLGDLPYVGWLFKNRNTTVERRELLVFITPRLVDEQLKVSD